MHYFIKLDIYDDTWAVWLVNIKELIHAKPAKTKYTNLPAEAKTIVRIRANQFSCKQTIDEIIKLIEEC